MQLVAQSEALRQLPLFERNDAPLTVAINGLALGGAEKIVLHWAQRTAAGRKVRVLVLRDAHQEYKAPPGVEIIRLHGRKILAKLERAGRQIAACGQPVVVCHLLRREERDALMRGGAIAVPVLHNAKTGWLEGAAALARTPHLIAVSEACARDLRDAGYRGGVTVIRHVPPIPKFGADDRRRMRDAWRVPQDAFVIGMIGAVKPQKNYRFALEVLAALRKRRDAHLVIVGGPVGKHGAREWRDTVRAVHDLGLRTRVAMPGFVPGAERCLAAFDLFLNTSDYEGFSIATQEALLSKLPCVARKVGGQDEIPTAALALLDHDAPPEAWADAIELAGTARNGFCPTWASFPSFRLWTLSQLAAAYPATGTTGTLFVTANLNAGGAQRSLVNLATRMRRDGDRIAVAVCGDSTADYFQAELERGDVAAFRTAASRDPFDHAEAIVEAMTAGAYRSLAFWNVDPKVKVLVAKALQHSSARLIDVSPGGYAFEELTAVGEFGRMAAFGIDDLYRRLDDLVLKYHGDAPARCEGKTSVIPNGVRAPERTKRDYALRGPFSIAVSGRIAPTKFLLEIVEAVKLLRNAVPGATLHVYGSAEPRHAAYAERVMDVAKGVAVFHGADSDAPEKLADHDLFVVLGRHQGCPNALLEAMAAGLPCIGNDDGGTRELLIDRRTGFLVEDTRPEPLARAMLELARDRDLAAALGRAGRSHVAARHSMTTMVDAYRSLFEGKRQTSSGWPARINAAVREWFAALRHTITTIVSPIGRRVS